MKQFRWLIPGMRVKRWLVLLAIAFAGLGLGFAVILQDLYTYHGFRWPSIVAYLSLRWLDHYHTIKAVTLLAFGVVGAAYAIYKLNASIVSAVIEPDERLVDAVYRFRRGPRGPRVVAIGGGHGLAITLGGLKTFTDNITAIVTVADDGGSSGKLRRDLSILPPGDFRNCIVALSDVEPLMEKLFQYRFPEGSGLEGHSFGNLYIAAMLGITGNFESALRESSRVLRVHGRILPSTLADLSLHAQLTDGSVVHGESVIRNHEAPIAHVFVEPTNAEAHPEAVLAILEADMIVLGPGSLYTSVLPNLLVAGIAQAIRSSKAVVVYVCNVASEPGETDDFHVEDYVLALGAHVGRNLINTVLVNRSTTSVGSDAVPDEVGDLKDPGIRVTYADIVDPDNPRYHEQSRLATTLRNVYRDMNTSRDK